MGDDRPASCLKCRLTWSLREVEKMLPEPGIVVSKRPVAFAGSSNQRTMLAPRWGRARHQRAMYRTQLNSWIGWLVPQPMSQNAPPLASASRTCLSTASGSMSRRPSAHRLRIRRRASRHGSARRASRRTESKCRAVRRCGIAGAGLAGVALRCVGTFTPAASTSASMNTINGASPIRNSICQTVLRYARCRRSTPT